MKTGSVLRAGGADQLLGGRGALAELRHFAQPDISNVVQNRHCGERYGGLARAAALHIERGRRDAAERRHRPALAR